MLEEQFQRGGGFGVPLLFVIEIGELPMHVGFLAFGQVVGALQRCLGRG